MMTVVFGAFMLIAILAYEPEDVSVRPPATATRTPWNADAPEATVTTTATGTRSP